MIKLQVALKDYLWGGEKLKTLFGREKDGIIAESWEGSVHKDGESTISGTGKIFAEYLKENRNAVDLNGGEFPVLIKYIDAAKNLSVQVHPNDEYAQKYEHDNGKTEILHKGDSCVCLGGQKHSIANRTENENLTVFAVILTY